MDPTCTYMCTVGKIKKEIKKNRKLFTRGVAMRVNGAAAARRHVRRLESHDKGALKQEQNGCDGRRCCSYGQYLSGSSSPVSGFNLGC